MTLTAASLPLTVVPLLVLMNDADVMSMYVNGWLANLVFGGPELDTLYATSEDKVYKRRINRKGLNAWTVVKPPMPRL